MSDFTKYNSNVFDISGPVFGGLLSAKLGRKWSLLASMFPLLVSWLLVGMGTNMLLLHIGRFCGGIASGMILTIIPLYCSEIATVRQRLLQ